MTSNRVWLSAAMSITGLVAGCATLPSELDDDETFVVTCKSARLPSGMPWYSRFAEHGWFDVCQGGAWIRIEILGSSTGVMVENIKATTARSDTRFGDRQVHVHAVYRGDAAREMIPRMLERAEQFPWEDAYEAWPGPNSNTFVEWLSQQVPGLWIEQYGTAVGKDYPINGWLQVGTTTTRTGVELETPYLGAQLGLVEGAELHLLGLTLGVDLWPPQLKLPFLPGIPWELAR
ncbi:MAG: DUF3750 domain-containing protein [Planctomycetes bacterium]|nr:DUF3750 domain-containing protein [Planctomycetota bacterium]